MRVLVVTTVHHPDDSRIRARQIDAMLDAGWSVTYAASFGGHGLPLPSTSGLRPLDLPRAQGRHRWGALLAARRLLRAEGPAHDLILLHDPELLVAAIGRRATPVVWDVHEDTGVSLELKPWLPRPLRRVTAAVVEWLERSAESHVELLLAEDSYQSRYRRPHLVVPNAVRVPTHVRSPGDRWAVYIGALTEARGARELVELGRSLAAREGGRTRLRLIGAAHPDIEPLIRGAHDDGALQWDGFLPSSEAMAALEGATAGVSLLHDTPNYRTSMPTKVLEYMAYGVPVVTTPLPLAAALVASTGSGVVVPFGDASAAADAVARLAGDQGMRTRMAAAGRAAAPRFDWSVQSVTFLSELRRIAAVRRP